jgi:hypothetical protein
MPAVLNMIDPQTPQSRSGVFWVVLGALAVAQLFAFWLLCSHQVRKAEARDTESVVRQMALSDCLQYIPGSTIASCGTKIESALASTQPSGSSPVAGATPVSFSYR